MKSKVLITGSSGFIGKNLINFLKEKKEFSLVTVSRDDPRLDDNTKNHFQISSIGSSTDWSKPLKGVARKLYLDGLAKLNKAEALANSGLGLSRIKVPVEKEKENERWMNGWMDG